MTEGVAFGHFLFLQVFFQCKSRFRYFLRPFHIINVADVPWLITISCDIFFAVQVAKDKTEFGQLFMDLSPNLRMLHHILVEIDIFTIDIQIKIQSKAGVMFGITGNSHKLLRIILTVFF